MRLCWGQLSLKLSAIFTRCDDNFSSAYGMAAWCYSRRKVNGWAEDGSSEFAPSMQIAKLGVQYGEDDAIALSCGGLAMSVFGDLNRAATLIDRAQALNPNLAMAWHQSGWVKSFTGQYALAVEHLERAMRLSPVDPQRSGMQAAIAAAHFAAGRFDIASSVARSAIAEQPNNFLATIVAAAADAMVGNLDVARSEMIQALKLDPNFRKISDRLPYTQPELLILWDETLRKAGLPE